MRTGHRRTTRRGLAAIAEIGGGPDVTPLIDLTSCTLKCFRERGGCGNLARTTGGQSMRVCTCIPALGFCILVLAFSLAAAPNATAATKAVKFGKLWDGHGTIANAVVIVENDKIQSVAASGTIPAGAEIIDLSL